MRLTKDLLKLYLKLEEDQKAIERERSAIRQAIIERGSGQLGEFLVDVTHLSQERIASLKECVEALGKEKLANNGLIKEVTQTRVTVRKVA